MGISADTILLISNIFFYVIIGVIIIKSFFGLRRGFWKSINSLIISMICYICIILFNTKIADVIYNIDYSFTNMVITLDSSVIPVTTIGATLRNVILTLMEGTAQISENSQAFQVCDAISLTLISYVVFIVQAILVIFIIAPLLSWIIYHLIFKHLFTKKFREKFKLRIAGLVTTAVKATISCAIFIAPFTALVSGMSDVINQYDLQLNESSKQLKAYAEAYDNSVLGKLLTRFKFDGSSFDIYLTDYVTRVFLDEDSTISFTSELYTVFDIAVCAINEGVYEIGQTSINYANALSKDFVSHVVSTLVDSDIITSLIPVVLSIATQIDEVKNFVDLSGVAWDEIDWSSDLSALNDIYCQFYDTGLMNTILEGKSFLDYTIDRSDENNFKEVFKDIDSLELMRRIMPPLFASFAKNMPEEYQGILPTDVAEYEKINLGYELECIYDCILTLSDIAMYSPAQQHLTFGDFSNFNLEDENTKITQVMNFALSEDAMHGLDSNSEPMYSSDSKEINGKESHPISTKTAFFGIEQENENKQIRKEKTMLVKGLLDSNILLDNIAPFVKMTLKQTTELGELDIEEELNEALDSITTKDEWVEEFDSLLEMVAVLYKNPNLPLDAIDISNETQVAELKKITKYLDHSKIINKVFPALMENKVTDDMLPFGMKADDLTFDCGNLGTELDLLLDISVNANKLSSSFSGDNALDNFLDPEKVKIDDLRIVLENIYRSQILNNKEKRNHEGNSNFAFVIKNIFSEQALTDIGLQIDEGVLDALDENDDPTFDGDTAWTIEIGNFTNALGSIQTKEHLKSLIKSDQKDQFKISDLDGDEIEVLIGDFAQSRLIEPSLGSIFNKNLQDAAASLNLELDFKHVDDWGNEGSCLNTLIKTVQSLDENSKLDLSSIDITKLGYKYDSGMIDKDGNPIMLTGADDLETILTTIYKLQSLSLRDGVHTNEPFANFIYNNITKQVFPESFLKTNDGAYDNAIVQDHKFGYENDLNYNDISNVAWVNTKPDDSYIGEIHNIVNLIRVIYSDENIVDGKNIFFDYTDEKNPTFNIELLKEKTDALKKLLSSINNIYCFRTVIGNVIEDQLGENAAVKIGSISLDKANSDAFNIETTLNFKEEGGASTRLKEIENRQAEIDRIIEIYDCGNELSGALDGTGISDKLRTVLKSDTVERLLVNLHDSMIFGKNKPGVDRSEFTIFEDTVKLILDESTISNMMFDKEYDDAEGKEVRFATADAKVVSKIKEISKGVTNVSWNEGSTENPSQISRMAEIIRDLTSLKVENEDGTTSDITDFNQIDSVSAVDMQNILTKMNQSYLMHDVVANATNTIFDKINVNDYIFNDQNEPLANTPLIDAHYIDDLKIIDSGKEVPMPFNQRVEFWNEDIKYLVALYDATKDGMNKLLEPDTNNQIRAGIFEKILPQIGLMKTTERQKADIMYKMLDKASLSGYISEKKDAIINTSLESELARRDTIKLLIDRYVDKVDENVTKEQRKSNWNYEGEHLDLFINELLKMKETVLDDETNKKTISVDQIDALFNSAYVYTVYTSGANPEYKHAYFTSELSASFIEQKIFEVDSSIVAPDLRQDYTYLGINNIEKNGMKGSITFAQQLEDFVAFLKDETTTIDVDITYGEWENKLIEALNLMGPNEPSNRSTYLGPIYLDLKAQNVEVKGSENNSSLASVLYQSLSQSYMDEINRLIDSLSPGTNIVWGLVDDQTFEAKGIEWNVGTNESVFTKLYLAKKGK